MNTSAARRKYILHTYRRSVKMRQWYVLTSNWWKKSNIIIFAYKTGKNDVWTSSFVVTLKETTMKLISSVIYFTLICIVYANDSEMERDGRSITYLFEITSSRLTSSFSLF